MDGTLTVSQVSRVAAIGTNGAGTPTAINMPVGEQVPTEGTIWKAAGLRIAYAAQHAFHHLEKHMQETPTQYIMSRFAGNDDKESLEFKCQELSGDEKRRAPISDASAVAQACAAASTPKRTQIKPSRTRPLR